VGNSHSGCQIAAEISNITNVFHVYRSKHWLLKRYSKLPDGKTYPTSLLANSDRKKRAEISRLPEEEKFRLYHTLFSNMSEQNTLQDENLYIDPESTNRPLISIAEGYIENVKSGLLIPRLGEISKIEGKKVILESGEEFEVDHLVFSTGYKENISFF
jgi:hypothetical protein